jgi:hypothetical protein
VTRSSTQLQRHPLLLLLPTHTSQLAWKTHLPYQSSKPPAHPPDALHQDPQPRAQSPPQLDDTASSRASKAPRLSVVHVGPSSRAYNTRSQGSAPAINVIGEPLLPMEPSLSDSDSAPDAAPEQHQAPPHQLGQFSNRDLFFSDMAQDAAGHPYHSAPPATRRPVFGAPHLPAAAPYHAGPPAQQLFQATSTPAAPAAAFPASIQSPPLVYGHTPQLGVTAPFSSAVSSSDALLDATLMAEQRLPLDLRQAFDLLRMNMDSMHATMRGDIRDLHRQTVSPTDLQHGFTNFV